MNEKKRIIGETPEERIKQKFLEASKRETDGETVTHVCTHNQLSDKSPLSTRLTDSQDCRHPRRNDFSVEELSF